MELQERPRANDSGLPDGAADRLVQFAMEHHRAGEELTLEDLEIPDVAA